MPINVTLTNSWKIAPQVFVIKILVFTLAASRLSSKVYLFHLGWYSLLTGHTENAIGYPSQKAMYSSII